MELEKVNTMNKKNQNKRSSTMRRYIFLFAMLSLFVIGCSEESSVFAPVNNVNTNEPNWIALPQAEGMHVNDSFTETKTLDGKKGSGISMYRTYSGGPFGTVVIDAGLFFPRGSFTGIKTFWMTNDGSTCVSTFGPSYVFSLPLTLNITYTGVNLSGINLSTVKFAYLGTDGSVQYAANDGIVVDLATGKLQVVNAVIPHFSRYGFVN